MIVGCDLDGVLYNYGDSVKRYLDHVGQGHLWKSGPTPEPFWEFYLDWGWSWAQFKQFCDDGVDAGFIFSGPARDNAVETMQTLAEMGHEIVIITDRSFGSSPINSHRATAEWLDEHNIWYDQLVFSADKTCVKTDIFVEDKYSNAVALTAAGTECWLVDRAWNKDEFYPFRINDISDFPAKVRLKRYDFNKVIGVV